MNEILPIIIIGLALSMDAFSLALGLGTLNLRKKIILALSLSVGIMHFIMPLIGYTIGIKLIEILPISPNDIVSVCLFIIAVFMIKDLFKNEIEEVNISIVGIFVFSLSVSIDSFTTGIGMKIITDKILLCPIIFSIISCIFTYIGLSIGKYAKNKIGTISLLLGISLLLITSIIYLCK